MNRNTIIDRRIYDRFRSIIYSFRLPIRQIRSAAIRGSGLKELSVISKFKISDRAEEIINTVKSFSSTKGIKNESFENQFNKLIDFIKNYSKEINDNFTCVHCEEIITSVVNTVAEVLKEIDTSIDFVYAMFNVAKSNDERLSIATVKTTMAVTKNVDCYVDDISNVNSPGWTDIENMEKDMKEKGVDMFSPEYGKIIIKKLRAYKSDITSTFNKYFGNNTVFAEYKLVDVINM